MSIVAMKNKGVIQYGGKGSISKGQGGVWLNQGPFGKMGIVSSGGYGEGFSINGGIRTGSYIGQSMRMSKSGTPFRGEHAMGAGGLRGRYYHANPVFNLSLAKSSVEGSQYMFIKPSVLSTKGMLEKKYKWIHSGQYPNNWVQPDSNLPYNSSYQMYVDNLMAKTVLNETDKEVKNVLPTSCVPTSLSRTTYDNYAASGKYTKIMGHQESSLHTLRIKKKCALSMPFPFAVNGGSRNSSGSSNLYPPAILQENYLVPPLWYTSKTC